MGTKGHTGANFQLITMQMYASFAYNGISESL